jgi:drug/metabolite transporter (DMT)-like permease
VGIAVFLGIFAGLCQASGLAIAKPVVEAGISPVAASSVRMFCAFIIHMLMLLFFHKRVAAKQPVTLKVFGLVFLNAFIALGLGMTLMLFAVDNGSIGLAAIFSSCSPVMILPIMWVYYHRRPQLSSWFAAVAVVAGTAVIFS